MLKRQEAAADEARAVSCERKAEGERRKGSEEGDEGERGGGRREGRREDRRSEGREKGLRE